MAEAVDLTPRMNRLAAAWQHQIIHGTALEQTPNYTGLAVPGRFEKGYLGELAFCALLVRERKRFRYRARPNGKSNPSEIDTSVRGRRCVVDVKTAGERHHKRLMFPNAQLHREGLSPPNAYAGVRLVDRDKAEIWGFLTRAEGSALPIGEFGHGVPTRHRLLADLRPIHDLLLVLDSAPPGSRVVCRRAPGYWEFSLS